MCSTLVLSAWVGRPRRILAQARGTVNLRFLPGASQNFGEMSNVPGTGEGMLADEPIFRLCRGRCQELDLKLRYKELPNHHGLAKMIQPIYRQFTEFAAIRTGFRNMYQHNRQVVHEIMLMSPYPTFCEL
jgi:hypothetical protein